MTLKELKLLRRVTTRPSSTNEINEAIAAINREIRLKEIEIELPKCDVSGNVIRD